GDGPGGDGPLRPDVRLDAGARPRPVGRPGRHRGLPRPEGRVRPRHRDVRGVLRRPQRGRLRAAEGGRGRRAPGGPHRALSDRELTGLERRLPSPRALHGTFGFDDPAYEWRRLFAELLGTFFLVLVGAG